MTLWKRFVKWLWQRRVKKAVSRQTIGLDEYMRLMAATPKAMMPEKDIAVQAHVQAEARDLAARLRESEAAEARRLAVNRELRERFK